MVRTSAVVGRGARSCGGGGTASSRSGVDNEAAGCVGRTEIPTTFQLRHGDMFWWFGCWVLWNMGMGLCIFWGETSGSLARLRFGLGMDRFVHNE